MKIPKTLTGMVVDQSGPLYNEPRMDFNTRFSLYPLVAMPGQLLAKKYCVDIRHHDSRTAGRMTRQFIAIIPLAGYHCSSGVG